METLLPFLLFFAAFFSIFNSCSADIEHMPTGELNFQNVSEALVEAIPELRKAYEEELATWKADEPPGPYNIFWDVLDPLFSAEFKSGKDPELLKRIFDFFEAMACSKDINVVGLLAIEIFEPMVASRRKLRKAWPYMGPKTRELAKETATEWERAGNIPKEDSPKSFFRKWLWP